MGTVHKLRAGTVRRTEDAWDLEASVALGISGLASAIRLVEALVRGEPAGREVTLALLVFAASAWLLVVDAWRRMRAQRTRRQSSRLVQLP